MAEFAQVSFMEVLTQLGFEKATYPALVADMCDVPPERVAIRFGGRVVTYGDLVGRIGGVAAYLRRIGLRPGGNVALVMDNSPEVVAAQFGIQVAGGVVVAVNTSLRGETLRFVLDNSDVSIAIVDDAHREAVEEVRPQLSKMTKVISSADPELLEARADPRPLLESCSQTVLDPAFVIYTSGTTGDPKGVIIKQIFGAGILVLGRRVRMREDVEVLYISTPLHHGLAVAYTALAFRLRGSIVVADRFHASRFWDDIRTYDCTFAYHVGTIAQMLFNQPPRADDGIHGLRYFIGGGMPPDLWVDFEKRFRVTNLEGYAATDGVGAVTNFGDGPPGSIGRPDADFEARVVGEDGRDVAPGEVGELVMRPRMALGGRLVEYYGDPAASEEKNRDGWVWTGDLVRGDGDGYLFFVDRKKDVIRRRGVNIAPTEIERVLSGAPDILECVAFPVPSALGEDEVKIVVVPRDSGLQPAGLAARAESLLPAHMRPRYVELAESLPKTGTERIQRYKLKQSWRTPRTWDVVEERFVEG